MITIVNYGMGNLGSIANMLKKIGAPVEVTSSPEAVAKAEKIILPGVGAFDNGMRNLEAMGLVDALNKAVLERKTPILGLCLGMHLFTRSSEEGALEGLGWLDARTVRFKLDEVSPSLPVPHMGWSGIQLRKHHYIFDKPDSREPRFYFAHSYHVAANIPSDVLAEAIYGYPFVAAVQRDNIIGVQFHPEKSHGYGLALLRNFVEVREKPASGLVG